MSLILDALRGERPSETPRPNPNAAQTDAVLQTLGYGRPGPTSSLNRIKRFAGYLAAGIMAIVLLGAAIWITRADRAHQPLAVASRGGNPPARGTALSADAPTPAGAPSSRKGLSASAGSNAGTLVPENDHFQLALYYQRIGDFENALVHYRAVLQRDELNAEAHNNLGLLYSGKGLFDDAVREFESAIAINQRHVNAHNNLGVAYLSQRKHDAAAAEFRTALGIDPHSPEAHYNLALIADERGNEAQALTEYRAFLQDEADHPELVSDVRKRVETLSR
jgi:tetratricopeptide (TPR) repeat protein